ncbi:MAG: hypothetical protein JSU04_00230 [Bdellovibrionales bacterium]|nr:hypothetical protein [Bdellovibrionales bacterium]
MDNNIEVVAELAAHLGAKRSAAKMAIANFYGVSYRTVTNWVGKGGIYEYGLLVEAVKQIKAGVAVGVVKQQQEDRNRFESIKQAYHMYTGYDSPQERTVMLFFAFECIDGDRVFTERQLIDGTGVPRSTLFKCIARLVEKGMLFRRKPSEGNGVEYGI